METDKEDAFAKGEAVGVIKKEEAVVRKMDKKGMSRQEISDLLDLPSDRVNEILDSHNGND